MIARDEGALYAMTYGKLKLFNEPTFGRVTFEYPSDADSPIVIDIEIDTTDERKQAVNPHVDKVQFSIAKELAAQLGIEIF